MGRAEDQPLRTVYWRRRDEPWMERCTLSQTVGRRSGLWTLEGTVVGTSEGLPHEVRYKVVCDAEWATAYVTASAWIGADDRELELVVDVGGSWLLGSSHTELSEVNGSLDVDLGFTPATNTLPIRRLGLEVGDSSEILTAWVRFPELTVEPFPQRYTRLADRRYLYESLTSDFKAELEVDELGLVVNYEGLFERLSESTPSSQPTR